MIKIGHRGAMGYAPENTISSFKKAIELGVDMVELDVYICKTREIVVIHDDKVDRTTNGTGYVHKKTLKELSELTIEKEEKIPTLNEVLDFINKRIKINIELKGIGTAKTVSETIDNYIKNKGWQYDDFIISSFNHCDLEEFRSLAPNIKIGILFKRAPVDSIEFAKKINAYSINPSLEYINKEFVRAAHNRGLKVFVWTVNNFGDIEKLRNLEIDGIFSNFPDRL